MNTTNYVFNLLFEMGFKVEKTAREQRFKVTKETLTIN